MMNRSGWIALAGIACLALALFGSRARADEPPARVTITLSCKDVQALVVLVGGWDALAHIAAQGGATKHQIEEVLRCLPSSNR